MYYAEKKILAALPKMAKAAHSEELRASFEKHEDETEEQVSRLEQVFEAIEQPAKGKTCDAINGIIDEAKEFMKEFKDSPLSMRALSPPLRRWSITRSAATERSRPGPASLAWRRPPTCSRRPSVKRRRRTSS